MEIGRQSINYEPPTFIKSNFIVVTNDQGWLFFTRELTHRMPKCLEGTQEMMPIFNIVVLLVVLD